MSASSIAAAVLLAASSLLPMAGTASAAAPSVTARVVAAADDEAGAAEVVASCTAYAEPTSEVEWTSVRCWTPNAASELSLPGPAVTTVLRATEPAPVDVCVTAEARYASGAHVTFGPRCDRVPSLPRAGDGCRAFAEPPSAMHSFGTTARGGFVCGEEGEIAVDVCLEVLLGDWVPISCNGAAAYDRIVTAEAYGCEWGLFLYRTTATGWRGGLASDRAESAPVPFFCTPLA